MARFTKLTLFTTTIKSSSSEARKVQVLYTVIKQNKSNNNPNKPRLVLKQAARIQEKK